MGGRSLPANTLEIDVAIGGLSRMLPSDDTSVRHSSSPFSNWDLEGENGRFSAFDRWNQTPPSMPQTLLAVLALVIAGALTLGQNKMMNDSVQSVMEDELEVIVSGTLLHTLEFADSRAFDDATTPTKLREALGLNGVISEAALDTLSADDLRFIEAADFNPKSNFGRTPGGAAARCDIAEPSKSLLCDDISDLETEVEEGDDGWRDVIFHTVGGDPLPVEVKVEVSYVEVSAPDVAVDYPTFHKRVDVYARSPLLVIRDPNHRGIHMNRIISYDPNVALEYLRRSLNADMDDVLSDP